MNTTQNRRPGVPDEARPLEAADPHLRAIIVAMLDTCCRPGELLCYRRAIRNQLKCRLANARPEPDLRYRSKATAGVSLANSIVTTARQGLSSRV